MTKKEFKKCPKCGRYLQKESGMVGCRSCPGEYSYWGWDNYEEIEKKFDAIPVETIDILPDNKIKKNEEWFILTPDESFEEDDRFEMFMKDGELMALGVDTGGYDVCLIRLLPSDIDELIEWLKERKEDLLKGD